jgi:hypothetical protein
MASSELTHFPPQFKKLDLMLQEKKKLCVDFSNICTQGKKKLVWLKMFSKLLQKLYTSGY